MNSTVEKLRESLRELQGQLEKEGLEARKRFQYRFSTGRVVFEEEARKRGRRLRVRWSVFLRRARPWEIVTAPVIYSLIIPFVLLDIFVTIYQRICFPVYGIPKVDRKAYIAVDRHKLTYLNFMQKLNCPMCARWRDARNIIGARSNTRGSCRTAMKNISISSNSGMLKAGTNISIR
mgnify:CR=1 FL=1